MATVSQSQSSYRATTAAPGGSAAGGANQISDRFGSHSRLGAFSPVDFAEATRAGPELG